MNERTRIGLEVLQLALLIGILGNVLLRETPWGINVVLFAGAFIIAMIVLGNGRKPSLWNSQTIPLGAALVFFAAMFAWRDSIELRILDALAMLTILGVMLLPTLGISTRVAGIIHYLAGPVWAGLNAAIAPFAILVADIDWKTIASTGWSKNLFSILRGLAVALPLLLIFGALFVAADAVYERMVQKVFNVPAETVFTHIILTSLFAWLSTGYFRAAFVYGTPLIVPERNTGQTAVKRESSAVEQIKREDVIDPNVLPDNLSILEHINREGNSNEKETAPEAEQTISAGLAKKFNWRDFDNTVLPKMFTFGAVETVVILGLLDLLFLSFVIVQVPYLFGGMELVQHTPDFKLAEYARRGFGELVAVTALVMPVLLVSHWLVRKDSGLNERLYRLFAGIQIVLLFVIMASATQRLLLLTGNLGYGMTAARLYPMILMVWMAILLGWFCLTVLRGARQYFAWGALWSAFFVLSAAHVLNPDDFIVKTNVQLMREGREFDAHYNARLSDDAVPALLEALPDMSLERQCAVKSRLSQRRIYAGAETDLRTWNWSRSVAKDRLDTTGSALYPIGCPNVPIWESIHESSY